jgi:RNA polymerase sigma-70 factor (ECF subfamily)
MPDAGGPKRVMGDGLDEVAAAARSGDREAFAALVRATYERTYTLAYRLTGNEEDARDVVQETYLRAYRGIDGFRGEARVTTWLYRITANCAATQLDRRRRHRHEPLDAGIEPVDVGSAADPVERAVATDLRVNLMSAIAELSPRLRAVVVLRDIYDLPHDAIAAELGISETAAKVRLHRARRVLKARCFPDRREPARREDVDRAV